jgi:PAS domain S-box-containing protein
LSDKWLRQPEMPTGTLVFSDEEAAWINDHPSISVNGGEWPPFILKRGEVYEGISVDILERAASIAGLQVEFVDGPWPEMMDKLKNGGLDLAQCISKTPERDQYLVFTDPYVEPSDVVFVRTDNTTVDSVADLAGMVVAVEDATHMQERLKRNHPDIKLVPVSSTLEGLRNVSSGKADAYIGTQIVAQFTAQKHLIRDLKIAADLVDLKNDLRFGVRKENSVLIGILQKALAEIAETEISQITSNYVQPMNVEGDRDTTSAKEIVSYKKLIIIALAIIALIILASMVLPRVMKSESIVASFGSSQFRLLVLTGLTFFVGIILYSGWLVLDDIRERILKNVETTLSIRVKAAEDALVMWVAERRSLMRSIGQDPELVEITERLLKVQPDADSLMASSPLADARSFFKENEQVFPSIGFFVISPKDISMGSMRDTNLGTPNLISIQRPDIIKRAFAGEVLFVPPIESDVQLDGSAKLAGEKAPATMFFIGPIRNSKGEVIAVMTLRVDPAQGLSRIMALGSETAGSYEAYTFSRDGILLSTSRFEHQLREMGILAQDHQSSMNFVLKDPGVNLLEGGRSQIARNDMPLTVMATGAIGMRQELGGKSGGHVQLDVATNVEGYRDYRGVPVYGAWLWDADLDLGITAEIDTNDALAGYYYIRTTLFWILGFTLVLAVGAILFVLTLGERTSRTLMRSKDDLEEMVVIRTAELATAEAHFRVILASMGEGLFQVDADGKAMFVNPAAAVMLGYDPEEILGLPIHELIHHTHADGSGYDVHDCPMNHAFTKGVSGKVGDEVLWRKDGTSFPVEYSATPILADGTITGAVIVFRDISERIIADRAIQESEERLTLAAESGGLGMWEWRVDVDRAIVSDYWLELKGISREEYNQSVEHWINGLHPEDKDRVLTALTEHMQGKTEAFDIDYRFNNPKTGWFWEHASAKVVERDQEGNPVRMVGYHEDVSRQKEMEKGILAERDQFYAMLNTSPVDVAISVDGVFQFANENIVRNTGLKQGDKALKYYVNASQRNKAIEIIKRDGKLENFPVQVVGAEGKIRDMLGNYYIFEYQGKNSVLGWALDVSDMKEIENELRAKFDDLERFRRLAVGREQKMIDLKKEINDLIEQNGGKAKYKIH